MKIRSKLADVDFEFGSIEYKKDHLIFHSAKTQKMQSKAYFSPDDFLAVLKCVAINPMVWMYILGFPIFYLRYRLRRRRKGSQREG